MRAMRDRAARAQGRRDQRCLGQFLLGRARLPGLLGMDLDAVRTLRRQRDRDRHQLLVLDRDRPALHRRRVECPECLERLRRQLAQSLQLRQVLQVVHGHLLAEWSSTDTPLPRASPSQSFPRRRRTGRGTNKSHATHLAGARVTVGTHQGTLTSFPDPPPRESSPGPPISTSLPAPPSSVSSPAPPMSRSSPVPPSAAKRRAPSFSPDAITTSRPPNAFTVSLSVGSAPLTLTVAARPLADTTPPALPLTVMTSSPL